MWYTDKRSDDIVISTRIRLARNIKGIPFPNAMTDEQKKQTTKQIKDAVIGGNSTLSSAFEYLDLDRLSAIDKQALTEQHMMSPDMLNGSGRALLLSKDKTMSIMLLEEDHIRLQIIMSGMALDTAWETADKVDDVIEENIEYAFDNEFGYLTSCPTNTGTGLRASVMMHLPALSMTGNLSKVISSATNLGIAVRGLYGEGSKAYGDLYQFSNQVTMGMSETEIINKLKNIVDQIIDLEKQTRNRLTESDKTALEDKVCRSYGTLRYARTISSAEAKSLLSDVMLGQNLGILEKDISPIELMIRTEPALMMKSANHELSAKDRDTYRAQFIRGTLKA